MFCLLATLPQGYLMTTKIMVVVRRGERGRRHRHHYLLRGITRKFRIVQTNSTELKRKSCFVVVVAFGVFSSPVRINFSRAQPIVTVRFSISRVEKNYNNLFYFLYKK